MGLQQDPRWQKRNAYVGDLTDQEFVGVLEDCVENPYGGRPVALDIIRRIRTIRDNDMWQRAKDLLSQIEPSHPNSLCGKDPIYGPEDESDNES